jgi:hypothetical protein
MPYIVNSQAVFLQLSSTNPGRKETLHHDSFHKQPGQIRFQDAGLINTQNQPGDRSIAAEDY